MTSIFLFKMSILLYIGHILGLLPSAGGRHQLQHGHAHGARHEHRHQYRASHQPLRHPHRLYLQSTPLDLFCVPISWRNTNNYLKNRYE